MKKYSRTLYKSKWDASTWAILGLVLVCCIWPIFLDDGWLPVIMSVAALAMIVVILKSVYYRIDGNQLIVYQFFMPTAFSIGKIKEIKKTKSVLSASAASLTDRIAITFTDRSVLKSTMPLVISPVRRDEFVKQLLEVNPDIQVEL